MSRVSIRPTPDKNLEKVARGIFRITLDDDSSWKNETGESLGAMGIALSEGANPPPVQSKDDVVSCPDLENIKGMGKTFAILIPIDHKMHRRAQDIHNMVEGLNRLGAQEEIRVDLEDQLQWLDGHLNIITHLKTEADEAEELFRQEVEEENIKHLLVAVESIVRLLLDRIAEDVSPRETASSIVDTGEALPKLIASC
ncbi:hypothetical protein JVT61DRAFT_14404 [Boletus reticuloceps]|uniref:Uncharacterized protein n=1 Tax=Boletus reticuloceps TaxID=495285 RepID=A0A8I2YVZ7_9AGAM|nr:hypothetical protein JVT61DRAFT_14404 [Boletus reticuloceps]